MSRGTDSYFVNKGSVNQEGERCMQFEKFLENPGPQSESSVCRIVTSYSLTFKF